MIYIIMPKLLIISVTCNQGSTGKIAEQVGLMMREEGWDVYYAHGARRVNPSQLKTIPFSSVKTEYLHALKALLFNADGLGSRKETKKLIEQIKEIKPDVIHLHNIHGYYLNYKLLFEYLNSTDIPIVLTLHDCWNFTGHCSYFNIANCEKWKFGCYDCPLIGLSNMSLIDRTKYNYGLKKRLLSKNKNIYIVPVSNWLGDIVKQSFLKDKSIKVIHNGIDLNVFKPYPNGASDKFKILGVSNIWDKRKGLDDFYKLRESLPLNEFEIKLVGLSEKQIKQLPLGITGIRNTSNQTELAKLYSEVDVTLSLSYAETFGLTIAEAAACGTPGIVYDNTALPSIISPETGIIVKTGDIAGVREAIIRIKNNSDKTKFTPEVCRKHAELNFDKNSCFREYSKLFKSIIHKN